MIEALTVGSLASMALETGCCLVQERRRPDVGEPERGRHVVVALLNAGPMLVMLIGMVDVMALGERVLPTVLWGLLFIALGLVLLPARNRSRLSVTRSFQLVAMGAVTVGMAIAHPAGRGGQPPGAHVHGGGGTGDMSGLTVLAIAIGVGYSIHAGLLAFGRPLHLLMRMELLSGAIATAGMAAMAIDAVAGVALGGIAIAVVAALSPRRQISGRPLMSTCDGELSRAKESRR